MVKRYRLPIYAGQVGLSTGRLGAAQDGWLYPRSSSEEDELVALGALPDDLDVPGLPPATTRVEAFGGNSLAIASNRGRDAIARVRKGATFNLSATNDTYLQIASANAPFVAAQLILYDQNVSTSGAAKASQVGGFEATFAATETSLQTSNPYVNGAVSTNFKTVTWGGATSSPLIPLPPPEPVSVYDKFTLTSLASDVIPIMSVPRNEAGFSLPLLYTRIWVSNVSGTGATVWQKNSPSMSLFDSVADGRTFKNYKATGQKVLTGGTTFPASAQIQLLFDVILYSQAQCFTLLGAGDSIMEGVITTDGVDGYGERAARLLTQAGKPCGWIQSGWGGMTPEFYFLNAKNVMTLHRPSYVLVQMCSPNAFANKFDPQEAEYLDTLRRGIEFAQQAIDLGVRPIFVGPCCHDTLTANGKAVYRKLDQELVPNIAKAFGAPYFSPAQAISGLTDPGDYAYPVGEADDGTHYSEAQSLRAGLALADLLRRQ